MAVASDTQNLEKLRTFWKQHHAFRAMAKLCEVVGMASTASVFDLVTRLKEAGYVQRVEGRIAPTKCFFRQTARGLCARRPAAASPGRGRLRSPHHRDFLVDHPERSSFCRVKGDSMRDAGLLDGDMVVVEANSPTKSGDIVVAVVDNQITVKYLRTDRSKRWRLEPANPAYDVISPTGSLEVLGVVVGSFRRFDRR
jgi:SOS-response transcriptional repressor LexA